MTAFFQGVNRFLIDVYADKEKARVVDPRIEVTIHILPYSNSDNESKFSSSDCPFKAPSPISPNVATENPAATWMVSMIFAASSMTLSLRRWSYTSPTIPDCGSCLPTVIRRRIRIRRCRCGFDRGRVGF
jgi:hypothetical protein